MKCGIPVYTTTVYQFERSDKINQTQNNGPEMIIHVLHIVQNDVLPSAVPICTSKRLYSSFEHSFWVYFY